MSVAKVQIKISEGFEKLTKMPDLSSGLNVIDLYASKETVKIGLVEYSTGLNIKIPSGHVGMIVPRKDIAKTTTLMLAGGINVLPFNFEGDVNLDYRFISTGTAGKKYNVGDIIAQLMIIPVSIIEVTNL